MWSNQPLISFIVPVYNVPTEMLHECLNSIFSLELKQCERQVIVVDDGNSYDITQSWPSEWKACIQLIKQTNKGLSIARNNALAEAKGLYVQFVDADDYLFAPIYNEVLAYLKQTSVDMVYFDCTFNSKPRLWSSSVLLTSGSYFMQHNNLRSSACGYVFKREVMGTLRFVPGIYYEDIEFTTQMVLNARSMAISTAQPYFYRIRKGSITSKKTVDDYKNIYLPNSAQILNRLQQLQVVSRQRAALDRRIAQLTMDHVYNSMRYTHDYAYVCQTLAGLKACGLYPFPNKHYTRKYSLFRHLVACPISRFLLTHLLH